MHLQRYIYRCIKCDYSFEDLLTPIVDVLECPNCHGDTVWCMNLPENINQEKGYPPVQIDPPSHIV